MSRRPSTTPARVALATALAAALATGCALPGPTHPASAPTVPPTYGAGPPATEPATAAAATLDDWRALYREPALAALIERCLADNRDVQRASARVVEARALQQIAGYGWLPSASVGLAASRSRQSQRTGTLPAGAEPERTQLSASANLSYEVDLWGRLGALSRAADADLAALERSRQAVALGVVATAASGWYGLVALDEEARVIGRTLDLQRRFLSLTQARRDQGAASGLDVAQAQAAVEQTVALQVDQERRRRLAVNALNVLAGRMGGDVARPPVADVPETMAADAAPEPGLPATLLERRPDLRASEAALRAAEQRVDAARAALFPSITLTGSAGSASSQLSDLFSGPALTWSFGLGLLQPLIDAQRNRFQVQAAQARAEQALLGYRQAVEQAFREVLDALAAKEAALQAGAARERQVAALQTAERAAMARYRGGAASYFEVVDAQRNLLAGELAAVQARLASRQATVDLYRALGGGFAPAPR